MIESAPWIKRPAGAGEGRPILHPILEEFARALVSAEVLAFPIATSVEIDPAPSMR
jgi:hypothetical protein